MQRIVDASLVAKWFLPEEHKDKAAQILRDFIDDKVQLAALTSSSPNYAAFF
jgi:predicted nucleic acid-binding protein